MHKDMRKLVQKAKSREAKIAKLAWSKDSEARKERKRMIENRHWYGRDLVGKLLSGNTHTASGQVTVL